MDDRHSTGGRQVADRHAPGRRGHTALRSARAGSRRRPWLTSGSLITGLAGAVVALAGVSSSPRTNGFATVVSRSASHRAGQNIPPTYRHPRSLSAIQRLKPVTPAARRRRAHRAWDVTSGGLEWRLTLRSDVVFQTESPVTLADVVRTLEETTKSPGRAASTACMEMSPRSGESRSRSRRPTDAALRHSAGRHRLSRDQTGATGVDLGPGPFVRTSAHRMPLPLVQQGVLPGASRPSIK